ncbi:tRNA adenosine(34) deaminase TadA [Gudongella sp. SC589]|jgi:tRNA(adenine34) deaminase|uniref:tRNA adenosine(34) deaminase TadA n=1 Tax=Gudongella sp. SC589 TaxID=3385990 RepID=UPI003904D904
MDEKYMKIALDIAKTSTYEVPVGAVVVYNDKVIGKGYNKRETKNDPTAHAEIMAIQEASRYLGGWRLVDCTLYVTLEPCAMCAGAIVNARIPRLVIGAMDPRHGCCGSVEDLVRHPRLNHRVEMKTGVLEKDCAQLLKDFFRELRRRK